MTNLNKAIQIAADAHDGQLDRGGRPYILHPLAVMLRMVTEDEMIVAVLHDTIEDTPVTLTRLSAVGFAPHIIDALDCLTRREDQSYNTYIMRIKDNPLAKWVKLADLAENMRLERLAVLTPEDNMRMEKYTAALAILQS